MDYIFYRIYCHYKKKDYIPIMMGIYFLFVIQLSLFLLLGVGYNFVTHGGFSSGKMNVKMAFIIAGVILGSLFVFNVVWYGRKSKVKQIVEKYQDDKRNEKIKTWKIFMLPVLIVLLTALEVFLFTK